MTVLDSLAVQTQDARGVLKVRVAELAAALDVLREEAVLGVPLSIKRVQVKLCAVEEAQEILRARESAERRAAAARGEAVVR